MCTIKNLFYVIFAQFLESDPRPSLNVTLGQV